MTALDKFERVEVASLDELEAWLEDNHEQSESIWLVTFKKHIGDHYVPYAKVVDAALCYGWIDSVPRELDADRTMLLLSPRRTGSYWSGVNKRKIAKLKAEGRLRPAAIKKIEAAKADGCWNFLDDVESLVIPDDLAEAFVRYDKAKANFDAFPPSSQRGILEWIKTAKRPETREGRIEKTAKLSGRNIRANH